MSQLRPDLQLVADLIPRGARVLDVGCGDGTLLAWLESEKDCDARGIELSRDGVNDCLAKGLSVVQGDADADLASYPTDSFDVAVLSQTIQATRAPDRVLRELLRLAPRAIVSFPNFGYWRVRLSLLTQGRMPVTRNLPVTWFETPNIHLCTVTDFAALVKLLGLRVTDVFNPATGQRSTSLGRINLAAEQAMFVIERG